MMDDDSSSSLIGTYFLGSAPFWATKKEKRRIDQKKVIFSGAFLLWENGKAKLAFVYSQNWGHFLEIGLQLCFLKSSFEDFRAYSIAIAVFF